MIYTPMTKKALRICYEAHQGQVDKTGLPYVFHPFHVAEQMTDEWTVTAALLHDVVEDTDWTLQALEQEGFPPEVLEALSLLTHDPAEPYLDYVNRLKENPIARKVKIADLRHNSDLTRLDDPSQLSSWHRAKYASALRLLTEENKTADCVGSKNTEE